MRAVVQMKVDVKEGSTQGEQQVQRPWNRKNLMLEDNRNIRWTWSMEWGGK